MKVKFNSNYLKGATALVCATILGVMPNSRAQSIMATGLLSGSPDGGGGFNYTLTLENSSSSTASIGTFWYAWVPGYFFLYSTPTAITSPSGWSGSEVDDGYYGSILFNATAGNEIQPGGSLQFTFNSADSPETMNGPAWYFYDQVGDSYVYSGDDNSGTSQFFTVGPAPVPEPASLSLLALGGFGLLGGWRKLRARTNLPYRSDV